RHSVPQWLRTRLIAPVIATFLGGRGTLTSLRKACASLSFAFPTAESGFSVRVPQLQPELDAPTLRLRDGGSPRWHGCPRLAANPWVRLGPPHEKAAQPVFGPASNSPHYRRAAAVGQQTLVAPLRLPRCYRGLPVRQPGRERNLRADDSLPETTSPYWETLPVPVSPPRARPPLGVSSLARR